VGLFSTSIIHGLQYLLGDKRNRISDILSDDSHGQSTTIRRVSVPPADMIYHFSWNYVNTGYQWTGSRTCF
jgi:hypothetical protein